MSNVKIFHNPRCSKSRQTLELIRSRGIEPEIVLYLEVRLTTQDIGNILKRLKIKPSHIIRKNEEDFKEHFGDLNKLNDDQIISLICQHPRVLERPIVLNNGMAAIGRPPENIINIL